MTVGIKPKGIDHICLWVSSLSRAKQYYESLFGVTCTERQGTTDTLVVEGEHIHFFIRQCAIDGIDSLAMQHLAFSVENLDAVVECLPSLGVGQYELGQIDCFTRSNYRWCEWLDPDGIRLECVQYI